MPARSKQTLSSYCDVKSRSAPSKEEEEIWAFIKIMYEDDSRTTLMRYFGFPEPTPVVEEPVPSPAPDAPDAPVDQLQAEVQNVSLAPPVGDGADFFDDLDEPEPEPEPAAAPKPEPTPAVVKLETPEAAAASSTFITAGEDDIQRNLIIGDYAAAAAVAMKAGRIADALVVASIGGQDLWRKSSS